MVEVIIIRVFVLSTGRCGSMTIVEAFAAADNFTVGHESRSQLHPRERFDYPDQHIESDNRLSWFLGELDRRFGDDAHYVHLRRDREAVARSYAGRWPRHLLVHDDGIIGAYAHGLFQRRSWPESQQLDLARAYVDTVTANIELFLADKTNVHQADLSSMPDDVEKIWYAIGATGNLERARAVAATTHNARREDPSTAQQAADASRRWRGYARAAARRAGGSIRRSS